MDLDICLNMIVKNESHVIKKTLETLIKNIKFSYNKRFFRFPKYKR